MKNLSLTLCLVIVALFGSVGEWFQNSATDYLLDADQNQRLS